MPIFRFEKKGLYEKRKKDASLGYNYKYVISRMLSESGRPMINGFAGRLKLIAFDFYINGAIEYNTFQLLNRELVGGLDNTRGEVAKFFVECLVNDPFFKRACPNCEDVDEVEKTFSDIRFRDAKVASLVNKADKCHLYNKEIIYTDKHFGIMSSYFTEQYASSVNTPYIDDDIDVLYGVLEGGMPVYSYERQPVGFYVYTSNNNIKKFQYKCLGVINNKYILVVVDDKLRLIDTKMNMLDTDLGVYDPKASYTFEKELIWVKPGDNFFVPYSINLEGYVTEDIDEARRLMFLCMTEEFLTRNHETNQTIIRLAYRYQNVSVKEFLLQVIRRCAEEKVSKVSEALEVIEKLEYFAEDGAELLDMLIVLFNWYRATSTVGVFYYRPLDMFEKFNRMLSGFICDYEPDEVEKIIDKLNIEIDEIKDRAIIRANTHEEFVGYFGIVEGEAVGEFFPIEDPDNVFIHDIIMPKQIVGVYEGYVVYNAKNRQYYAYVNRQYTDEEFEIIYDWLLEYYFDCEIVDMDFQWVYCNDSIND